MNKNYNKKINDKYKMYKKIYKSISSKIKNKIRYRDGRIMFSRNRNSDFRLWWEECLRINYKNI